MARIDAHALVFEEWKELCGSGRGGQRLQVKEVDIYKQSSKECSYPFRSSRGDTECLRIMYCWYIML